MSFENPIKIEPKHIYEYNTNIVNNNKIDYVKLTEYQVSMPQTDVVNENFVCRERKPSTGGEGHKTYTTTFNDNYYNLFDNEKNRYFPLFGMYRYWSSISDLLYESHFVYYKIPFVANSTGNIIAFNFQRNVSYRAYHGDGVEKEIDLEKTKYTFLPKDESVYCGGAKYLGNYGDRREYVYFNTFASEEEFENKYIGELSWGRYFLKSISNYHSFIAGLTFQNGKGTLMLIVDEFDYFESLGAYSVENILLNFTISLSMDVYKSEEKTYTFALNNGVLKNVDDIPNFNYQNKKGYTLPDNPMLTNLTVRTEYNPDKKVSEVIAENILTKFKNGKQTASMTVNCTDYYDMLGSKIIGEGVARKTLEAGDYVIPYIKADEPLAKKKDGTPKKFEITSAEFTYEGLAQKHLKMVEVVE